MTPLQAEQLRRRQAGLPQMTPDEISAFQNQIDTVTADANAPQIGSTKTTVRGGTKLIDGKYKGMHPRAATNAAITGAAVPTGKSGYVKGGPLSPDRPSGLTQRAAPPSAAPMFSGMDTPAAPAASVAPSVTSRLLSPSSARPPMLNASNPTPASAAPSAAPAMARAITDQRDMGVMARDANGTQFNSGAVVSRGASPTAPRTLTSPYGSGSVTFSSPGQKPAGDPVLRAATAYAKQRQAKGQFGDIGTPPEVLAAARAPVQAPAPAAPTAAPQVVASPSTVAGPPGYLSLPDLNAGPPKGARNLTAPPMVSGQPNNVKISPDRPVDPLLVDKRGLTNPAPAPGMKKPSAMPKSMEQLKQEADAAALARRPGFEKATAAVGQAATAVGQGVASAAKTANTAVPGMVGGAMDAANNSLDSIAKSTNDLMKPTRDWLQGSKTASPAEIAYQEALKAEQRKKTGPVAAIAPAGSQPISRAGVTKPEANVNIWPAGQRPNFTFANSPPITKSIASAKPPALVMR